MKIEDQGQFNQVVVQALHNLYALHLDPDAILAQDYGTGSSDSMVRQQMADLERFAFYPAHEPEDEMDLPPTPSYTITPGLS